MKEAFARRRRGLEPVTVPHPRLEATLADTYGTLLYEEDVMRVAAAFCGLPLAEGEVLRRAIAGARGDEEFRFLQRGFVAQALRSGVTEPEALGVWRELTRFAAYAFCKAHAAGYGRLGWECAALKTRFPAAWAVGILNHHAGMYPTWVHVEDLRRGVRDGVIGRRAGVDERPAFANPGPHAARGAERRGARPAGGGLLAAREAAPFACLADVVERARPTPPELEALVLAGAPERARGEPAARARGGVARRDQRGTPRTRARRSRLARRRGVAPRRGAAARRRGARAPEFERACAASSPANAWFGRRSARAARRARGHHARGRAAPAGACA